MSKKYFLSFIFIIQFLYSIEAQKFYYGADISYTNEMEDCGTKYKENEKVVDLYDYFSTSGCNLVRVRLWNNPSWYKTLNSGNLYSDINDVIKTIQRAKIAKMDVLLDFHLSDTWADPSHQLVPKAWESVVNNLPILKDSLAQYISRTLNVLDANNAIPDMIQIGNETNKGIMLSAEDDKKFTLNWPRNAALFNTAIKSIRDYSKLKSKPIKIAIHIANPKDADWLAKGFYDNGVRDFDIIGLSYYWAWHKPITIADCGKTIATLKSTYKKDVMIFETGYIWTTQSNDNASNIISEVHPSYSPASPDAQYRWLHDLSAEVKNNGGIGVCYWEPTWVSTSCRTQWGQGSHQEHAAFFDFKNNALLNGGIKWLNENKTNATNNIEELDIVKYDPKSKILLLTCCKDSLQMETFNIDGKLIDRTIIWQGEPYLLDQKYRGTFIYKFKSDNNREIITTKTITLL